RAAEGTRDVRAVRALIGALAAALATAGCGDGGPTTSPVPPGAPGEPSEPSAIALTFLAEIKGEPFACGRTFDGVGTSGSTIEPADLRFYVSEVRLVGEDGAEAPL